MSQKVLQYVEIDIDYCSLTYSVAPCQASNTTNGNDELTKVMLHFDAANGSTTFTDNAAGGTAKTWGATGSAIISTTQSKFGGSALRCQTPPDAILSADSPDFTLGGTDFTIDCWFYLNPAGAGARRFIWGQAASVPTAPTVSTACEVQAANNIRATICQGSTSIVIDTVTTPAVSTWHHVALVRTSNVLKLFLNGVQEGGNFAITGDINDVANSFGVGALGDFTTLQFQGYIDEFRYSVGVARWSANFTPPTAAFVAKTGSIKCFNSLVTCQDRANFNNVPVTLRFAVPTADLPTNIDCIPNIKDISFDPAVISLGENLGERATLTVSFDDHRHSDAGVGFDKYFSERLYDPYSQGTFWGKFRSRQPFLRGRNLRWINGTVGQTLAQMETRHYVIDSFTGPDNDGKFQVIAKDILKLADGDRALAPQVSNGFLSAGITASSGIVATLSPSGIGNAEYPASGIAAIGGSEIVIFTRSGDALTLTNRGFLNTVAAAHSAQDRVQMVLFYSAQAPDVIIADLLANYAGVSGTYIPTSDWNTEVSSYLNRLYTAVIAQPTSVNDLISELIEQAGLSMWWDDRNQKIGLLVLRGLVYTNYLFDENSTIAETLEVTEQPDKRLSQVHTYFGQINSLTSLTDKSNYRSASVITNAQAETDYGSAAIKEIFSRWIPAGGRSIADRLGSIMLSRFTDPPRHVKVSVLRGSTPEIQLARGYQVGSKFLQDATGAAELVNTQVTRLTPNADIIGIEMDEVIFTAPAEDLTHRQIIIDANSANLNLRSIHDALFPTPDASITVICTINLGVKVSSASAGLITLDVGSWPSGVTIIVAINGDLRGAGGNGGNFNSDSAGDGGTAIFTRVPIKLALAGTLWGGGGGGGGSTYGDQASGHNLPGAGGGGAGIVGGPGGTGAGSGTPGTEFAGGGPNFFYGGTGGGPGLAGSNGFQGSVGGVFYPGWPGHRGGYAIDGASFVTSGTYNPTTFVFTPGALGGDLRGGQVN